MPRLKVSLFTPPIPPPQKKALSVEQADLRDRFKMPAGMSAHQTTWQLLTHPLSPASSNSLAVKAPENKEKEPVEPELEIPKITCNKTCKYVIPVVCVKTGKGM